MRAHISSFALLIISCSSRREHTHAYTLEAEHHGGGLDRCGVGGPPGDVEEFVTARPLLRYIQRLQERDDDFGPGCGASEIDLTPEIHAPVAFLRGGDVALKPCAKRHRGLRRRGHGCFIDS